MDRSVVFRAGSLALVLCLGASGCSDDGGTDTAAGDGIVPAAGLPPSPAAGSTMNAQTGAETGTEPGPGSDTGMGTDTGMGADTEPTTDGAAGASSSDGTGSGDEVSTGDGDGDAGGGDSVDTSGLENFSFFVTSLEVLRELSGSQDGFGGDLGGIAGADAICQQAAEAVGFGAKTWRAFLSAHDDGSGNPVHAIDRIGEGPWYDRNGRLIAENKAGLLQERPAGDPQTVNDLPNEFGEGLMQFGDTHDIMTGSNTMGQLDTPDDPATTCNSWTSTTAEPGGGFGGFFGGDDGGGGGLRLGHSWPAGSGMHWITAHTASSCAAGVNLVQNGPGDGSSVGAGGGWGGFYCFALQP